MTTTLNGIPAKVMGKVEAERPCDLCGNTTLKTAVVVACEGAHLHIGRDCAGMAIYGDKTSGNARRVDKLIAAAERYAIHREHVESNKIRRICSIHDKRYCGGAPNMSYRRTGRKIPGSYFATLGEMIVRVDGKDAEDVSFYEAIGFVQSTEVV